MLSRTAKVFRFTAFHAGKRDIYVGLFVTSLLFQALARIEVVKSSSTIDWVALIWRKINQVYNPPSQNKSPSWHVSRNFSDRDERVRRPASKQKQDLSTHIFSKASLDKVDPDRSYLLLDENHHTAFTPCLLHFSHRQKGSSALESIFPWIFGSSPCWRCSSS